jgi:hypothetical protein
MRTLNPISSSTTDFDDSDFSDSGFDDFYNDEDNYADASVHIIPDRWIDYADSFRDRLRDER